MTGEGIDYRRADFRHRDGTTRIRYLWDQTLKPEPDRVAEPVEQASEPGERTAEPVERMSEPGERTAEPGERTTIQEETGINGQEKDRRLPPEGFSMGVEFSQEQINRALELPESEGYRLVPSRDSNGHGTAVAGIAAGSNTEAGGIYEGVAPESELLIVKLGLPDVAGFPRTTEIMRGVTYAIRKAVELQRPLVINLSFGNSYGAHDGSSLLERFLDNAAEIGRTVICVGSGNEGNSAGHTAGNVQERQVIELAVGDYETNLSIQLWKHYGDRYRISLRSPGGVEQELPQLAEAGKYTLYMEQTEILLFLGEPLPYSVDQEIYFDMIPNGRRYINSGVWQIILRPEQIVTGQYYLYLPGSVVRSSRTRFYEPVPQVTLTIPSTASKVITVGAYDSTYDSYADFSGRGYADTDRTIGVVMAGLTKPDLAAPGVNIVAPDIYGSYQPFTGTSFAAPLVSGSAALLMEWGIVRENDVFLYGEKVKSYLRAGAQPLRGETEYPNDRVGWGALCVAGSLPE